MPVPELITVLLEPRLKFREMASVRGENFDAPNYPAPANLATKLS